MKRKIGLKSLIIALILAILAFFIVIFIEQKMLNDYEKATVVVAVKNISAYTKLDVTNINEYFAVVEVPKDFKMSGSYSRINDINTNAVIKYDIEEGEQLTKNKIVSVEDEVLLEYKEPVSVSLKVENISYAVSGTLKRGDIVDVIVTNDLENECTIIKKNVFILGAYDSSGNEVIVSNENSNDSVVASVIFNFLIEREDYPDFVASTSGKNIKLIKVDNIR